MTENGLYLIHLVALVEEMKRKRVFQIMTAAELFHQALQ